MVRFSPLGWEIYDVPTFVSVCLAIALSIAGTVIGSIALHRVDRIGEPSILSGVDREILAKQADVNSELVELSATFSTNEWCIQNASTRNVCIAFLEILGHTIQDLEFNLRPESQVLSDLYTTTIVNEFNMSVFNMAQTLPDAELKKVEQLCSLKTVTTRELDVCILSKGLANDFHFAAEMMAFVTPATTPHGRRAVVCAGACKTFLVGVALIVVDKTWDLVAENWFG